MVQGAPDDSPKQLLVQAVQGSRRHFRRGSRGWATAHFVSLLGGAVLSAGSAALLKVPATPQVDLASLVAVAAAVLASLNSLGGFQTKWTADRNAFYALDELILDLELDAAHLDDARRRYRRIIRTQRDAWVAAPTRQSRPEGPEARDADDPAAGDIV